MSQLDVIFDGLPRPWRFLTCSSWTCASWRARRDLFAEDMYADMNTSLGGPGCSQVISNLYAEVLVLYSWAVVLSTEY